MRLQVFDSKANHKCIFVVDAQAMDGMVDALGFAQGDRLVRFCSQCFLPIKQKFEFLEMALRPWLPMYKAVTFRPGRQLFATSANEQGERWC